MKFLSLLVLTGGLVATSCLSAQELDLSAYELQADYALSQDGVDQTSNYEEIRLENPIFDHGGVFSRGCWYFTDGAECLIETPRIPELGDLRMAIQVDFRVTGAFSNAPIIVAGRSRRYLGIETKSNGSLALLKNNSTAGNNIPGVILNLDEWYTITLVHDKVDLVTSVYLDSQLIYSQEGEINFYRNDDKVSNTKFSNARSFEGYLKNFRIYSSNIFVSTENIDAAGKEVRVYPNPVGNSLNVDVPFSANLTYSIFDTMGRCITKSTLDGNTINTTNLHTGLHVITFYDEGKLVSRSKFIKE